ncbi:MAG: alpha/beta hydrolase [Rhodoferax sp.]|nr:alpha/beta hydrolase [Rhodoferax sp.]
MGRTPLSGWPMLRRLRQYGLQTQTFGYTATFEEFDDIVTRLVTRLQLLAASSDYVVVGHSLGGVLLRAALSRLSEGTRMPQHVYLLGSPIQPSRIAIRLRANPLFRAAAGDCGQLLGSDERMGGIGAPTVPTTGIAGVRGIVNARGPFGEEANDGVVTLSEVSAPWLVTQVQVPLVHTWLPSSALVANIIAQGLMSHEGGFMP